MISIMDNLVEHYTNCEKLVKQGETMRPFSTSIISGTVRDKSDLFVVFRGIELQVAS